MSSTPQDPKDEAPVTGTNPEDAPQTETPQPTPPTEATRTTPPTTPPPPPWATSASGPTPPSAAPSQSTAAASDPTEAAGQHAAPRPYPPSAPQVERTPTRPTGSEGAIARERPTAYSPTGLPPATSSTAPAAAASSAAAPQDAERPTASQSPAQASAEVTPSPTASAAAPVDRPRRELPESPAKPGLGRHLLAGVLGLVLTPFAMLLIGVGTSRLADIAGTNDMGTDLLGISLLALGLALVAVIVLLGAWSAVLPVVGGLVWGVVLGLAYLMYPVTMEDSAEAITSSGSVPVALEQLADAGMTGYLLVLGTLMIAAGIATALARRRGRRWAERVAVADRAQADAAREDAALSATPDGTDAGQRPRSEHRNR